MQTFCINQAKLLDLYAVADQNEDQLINNSSEEKNDNLNSLSEIIPLASDSNGMNDDRELNEYQKPFVKRGRRK